MSLEDLKHVRRELPGGGHVVVLDTGAVINPESEAMLQALHSRSLGGIQSHLQKLAKSGSEKFMSVFYVGYGHKSIGDCGSTTLFVEGVSMLAAKAIQQYPLYNGQEASTRYIDFEHQAFIDPINTKASKAVLEKWRAFYLEGIAVMKEELKRRHPRLEGEEEKIYEKAINARAFDIMRGFLPAGASTNLAWHTELRHAADHLMTLRHHPLPEVHLIADTLEAALIEKFPSSFSDKRYEKTEEYNKLWMTNDYYFNEKIARDFVLEKDGVDRAVLRAHKRAFSKRPPMTDLPKFFASAGTMRFGFFLDFGSFRDIQRHRAVAQRMPLLSAKHGFEPWYLEQLPETLVKQAKRVIKEQLAAVRVLKAKPEVAQYYLPMGMRVRCQLTGDLPALVYLVERRARLDVHPTLRIVAIKMGKQLEKKFGKEGLKLYMEQTGDRFNYARGKQDIVERNNT